MTSALISCHFSLASGFHGPARRPLSLPPTASPLLAPAAAHQGHGAPHQGLPRRLPLCCRRWRLPSTRRRLPPSCWRRAPSPSGFCGGGALPSVVHGGGGGACPRGRHLTATARPAHAEGTPRRQCVSPVHSTRSTTGHSSPESAAARSSPESAVTRSSNE